MEQSTLQQLIFQHIKNIIPPHTLLANEIGKVLNVSEDGAYRRIRNEKGISLEEAKILALHFGFSIDQFLGSFNSKFLFSGNLTDDSKKNLNDWLENILALFTKISSSPDCFLYYPLRDAPFCSFFQVPELAAFKFFFWRKSILYDEQLKNEKFSLDQGDESSKLGKQIIARYNQIPGIEIWTLDSISTTLSQVEYYKESGVFESPEILDIIYSRLEDLVDHWDKQAELGTKFKFGETPTGSEAQLKVFVNESNLWNNCILAEFNNTRLAIVNQSILNVIETNDIRFTDYVYKAIHNLMRKSSLITKSGEKERIKYFHKIKELIKRSRNGI